MSGHSSVWSHLDRLGIVEGPSMSRYVCKTMRQWNTSFDTVRGLSQKDTDLLMHCPNWMCYNGLLFGICVVYESGVELMSSRTTHSNFLGDRCQFVCTGLSIVACTVSVFHQWFLFLQALLLSHCH
jgi:hypothetical protein